jgi:protein PhnA
MTDQCPQCVSTNMYPDGALWICADCGFELNAATPSEAADDSAKASIVKDAFGSVLADGDSVVLVKDLKLKGGEVLKLGTKVARIRLKPEGDHNIDCKIDGVGMMLKSEFVKKA